MELDDDMYVEERQLHAKVFTVSINEELGQVNLPYFNDYSIIDSLYIL
jgi:hypothetical protein